MALTMLNHFYWQIPEAKIPFMIADVVIVVAMRYIEKGVAAENKLRLVEEKQAKQTREMDKGEKLARNKATRQQQHIAATTTTTKKSSSSTSGKKNQKKSSNIQQPSKRD